MIFVDYIDRALTTATMPPPLYALRRTDVRAATALRQRDFPTACDEEAQVTRREFCARA